MGPQPAGSGRPDPGATLTQPEAVILCGGRGERLRGVLPDRPKALAPLRGRPFIEWLLMALAGKGLRRIVLATGYRGDAIARALGDGRGLGVDLVYSQEPEPLGTGGALRLSASLTSASPLLILNGDRPRPPSGSSATPTPLVTAASSSTRGAGSCAFSRRGRTGTAFSAAAST
ncbi:MAG: hypothetical protein E6J00_05615 [Chloroflexi bacterium]|nr:MAG: hypothetical protein E6J00_05615 [Chloroflexota bacterium]